jgi:hypothetical protein
LDNFGRLAPPPTRNDLPSNLYEILDPEDIAALERQTGELPQELLNELSGLRVEDEVDQKYLKGIFGEYGADWQDPPADRPPPFI